MVIGLIFLLCSEGIKGDFFPYYCKASKLPAWENVGSIHWPYIIAGQQKINRQYCIKPSNRGVELGLNIIPLLSSGSGMAPKGVVVSLTTSPVCLIASIKCHYNICQDGGHHFIFQYICPSPRVSMLWGTIYTFAFNVSGSRGHCGSAAKTYLLYVASMWWSHTGLVKKQAFPSIYMETYLLTILY